MKIIIATDSFKGCLTSSEAGQAIKSGVIDALGINVDATVITIADGGEGTLNAMRTNTTVDCIVATSGPLGEPVTTTYLFDTTNDTAIIEIARICGLPMIGKPTPLTALSASSKGVSTVIIDAIIRGARHIMVGLGGSATTDGGAEMIEALRVNAIAGLIDNVKFTIMTDVDNPLLGPNGAAATFAPQKGASSDVVEILERRLMRLAATAPRHYAERAGAGAAGGLGWAFMAHFGAKRVSGIETILEHSQFREKLTDADIVITGEGRIDMTSLGGKTISGIIRQAIAAHTGRIIALGGSVDNRASQKLARIGVEAVAINPPERPLAESLRHDVATASLRATAARLLRR